MTFQNALSCEDSYAKSSVDTSGKKGAYTYECWLAADDLSKTGRIVEFGYGNLYIGHTQSGNLGYRKTHSISASPSVKKESQVIVGQKFHVAETWESGNWKLFANGILIASGQGEYAPAISENGWTQVTIGTHLSEDLVVYPFHGIIDEVRISNVARYTKDFTPENRFENDEHTLALYHFDEGSGDVLKDSSGNGHDGKIVGAKWVRVDDELKVIEEGQLAQPVDPYARDREAAEWVISQGGKVDVHISDGDGIKRFGGVTSTNNLPNGDFRLVIADLRNCPNIEAASLAHLRLLRALSSLKLTGSHFMEGGLEHLYPCPSLEILALHGCNIRTSNLHGTYHLPQIRRLRLEMKQVDDEWEFLSLLPTLATLELDRLPTDIELVTRLEKMPQLRHILATRIDMDAPSVARLQRINPMLQIIGRGPQGEYTVIGSDPVAEAAKRLADNSWKLNGVKWDTEPWANDLPDAWNSGAFRPMNIAVPSSQEVTDEDLAALSCLHVTFESIDARNIGRADGFAEALREVKQVSHLLLAGSNLEDMSLRKLAAITSIGRLDITGTKVTKAGIEEFKRLKPQCVVISDFGTFPYEHKLPPGWEVPAEELVTDAQPADPYTRDREAAEWVLSVGGEVDLYVSDGDGRKRLSDITVVSDLPDDDFRLFKADLSHCRNVDGSGLRLLSSLPRLASVNLAISNLKNDDLRNIYPCPQLEFLDIIKSPIRTSALDGLNHLPQLINLWVESGQCDDNWEFMHDLPSLASLYLDRLPDNEQLVKRLKKLPNVCQVVVHGQNDWNSPTTERIQKENPKFRFIVQSKNEFRVVGRDPVAEATRTLSQRGWKFSGNSISGAHAWSSDMSDWEHGPFKAEKVVLPDDAEPSDEDLKLFSRVGVVFAHIDGRNLKRANLFSDRIREIRHLDNLLLSGSDLDDNGLRSLANIPWMMRLDVTGTKVTKAGIEEFKRLKPQCIVVSDFGTFPYEHKLPPGWDVPAEEPTSYNWPKDQPAPAIAPFTAEEAKQHQEAWAKHLGVPVEMENSIGMKFRVIPPGEFLMGSSDEEIAKLLEKGKEQGRLNSDTADRINSEGPQHRVILTNPLLMSDCEITRGQFRRFVEDTGYKTEAAQSGKGGSGFKDGEWVISAPEFLWNTNLGFEPEQTDDHPVVNVSWNDAMAFCEWLSQKDGVNYRLPTEAEWEFACRAGNPGRYSFGNDEVTLPKYASNRYEVRGTTPIRQKLPNNLGMFDMHGNVQEWCYDWRASYPFTAVVNPVGTVKNSGTKPMRGGGFHSSPIFCRSAYRYVHYANGCSMSMGFRIVRTFEKYEPKKAEQPTTYNWPTDQPAPAIAPFTAEEARQHQEAWAKHLGVPVEMENSIGMKFRVIPPGEFMMGSSDEEIAKLLEEAKGPDSNFPEPSEIYLKGVPTEGPQHRVAISRPLGVGVYEVTRGQFRQFVEATGYKTDAERNAKGGSGYDGPSRKRDPKYLWNSKLGFGTEQTDDHPVVNVSWNDAVAFCLWLSEKEDVGYRLLTEAEWEFACRAGNQRRYWFGEDQTRLAYYAWHNQEGGKNTVSIGRKGANPFGLFDVLGNVWEWCEDGSRDYRENIEINPFGARKNDRRMLRGGTFALQSDFSRPAYRYSLGQSICTCDVGFRVVRTFSKQEQRETADKKITTYNWPKDQPNPAIAPFTAEEATQHQEQWAKHLGVEVESSNSIGMKLRVIPPGEFLMGSSEEEITRLLEEVRRPNSDLEVPSDIEIERIPSEGPQHRVSISRPIAMSIHEVTRGQFRRFVEETNYKTDAEKDGKGGSGFEGPRTRLGSEYLWNTKLGFETEQSDEHPVVNVSWNDAVAFCSWLSEKESVIYRLPTEAEWEFGCRAGNQGRYPFGNGKARLGYYAWYGREGGMNTKAVGKKGANPFGLFDVLGNVWEWCQDSNRTYEAISALDPFGRRSAYRRILRGGSFVAEPDFSRSAYRYDLGPSQRSCQIGFRIVRTFEKYEPKKAEAEGPAVAPTPNESSVPEKSETPESEKKSDEE